MRNVLSLALAGPVAVAAVALVLGGCGTVTGAPSGSQCFSAVDCAAGLICVAKGSSRVCSSDLTSVETEIDAGGEGGEAAALGQATGDASTAPPADASTPMDATVAPSSDAGAPAVDASGG